MPLHFSEGRATPDDIERGQGEHDVLLPKGPAESHHRDHPRTRAAETPNGRNPAREDIAPNAETLLLKVTSTLAALHAGKLPSQEQIQKFLLFVLRSGALNVSSDDQPPSEGVGWVKRGDGRSYPPSGVQAGPSASALGLEGARQPSSASGIPGAKPKPKDPNALCDGLVMDVNDLAQRLLRFGMEKNDDDRIQELLWRLEQATTADGQAAATHVAMHQGRTLPMTTDIYTLISSFSTLLRTLSASSVLRAALSDTLDLLREFIAHTAHDVEQAASRIQHRAEEVEAKARESLEHGPPRANEPIVEGITIEAKEALDATKADVFQTAESVKKGVKDVREGSVQAGQDILIARLYKIIICICRDPAARLATKSIFTLLRKYASDIAESLPHESDSIEETADGTRQAHPDAHTLILQDLKVLLERIGGGHSLSKLLNCFEHLIHDISVLPVKVAQDVAQHMPPSPDLDATPTPAHRKLPLSIQTNEEPPSPITPSSSQSKKSRRKKKKTTLQQTLQSKSASSLFALSASPSTSSQSEGAPNLTPLSTPDSGPGPADAFSKVPSEPLGNPVADYFVRLGDFMERVLDDPGFISSRQGREDLDHLVKDGVSLLEAVEETVAEATTEEGSDSPITPGGSSEDIKQQFRADLHIFLTELHNYTDAIHKDPTTMGLVRSVCKLTDDFFAFLNELPRLRRWSTWAAWLIPRFLRTSILPALLPSIVPYLEFNSPSVDGKIWALFVKELVNMGDDEELETPVAASLVPDTVVIRQWTEVRINMAQDDRSPASGGLGTGDPSGSTVQSTSRLHLHLDGLRGRVDDVGYWFRYFGACGLGYEDEGLLSVRLGDPERKEHDGLGMDIEIEVDNENDDEDDDGEDAAAPSTVGGDGGGHRRIFTQPIVPKPLFKVNTLNVTASNVHVEVSESRHWILNKFFLQPLAGPILARSVQMSLESRLRRALETLADLLGEVKTDVTRRRRASIARKEKEAKAADAFGFHLTDAMWDWIGAFAQILPSRFPGARSSNLPESIHRQDSDADAESSLLARSVPTLVEDFAEPQEVEEDSVVITVSAGISQGDPPIIRDTLLEAVNSPEPQQGLAVTVPVDIDVANVRENVEAEWEERTVREQSGTWRSDAFDW